ncbi:MAG: hypothetical protein NWS20_03040 [Rickettsiaceae bacterium]|nr:hypothetical protein [Rickettsiaceae bacterium]MDP5083000.1 hypothetical protein [Rickettsiaceae bacterium]
MTSSSQTVPLQTEPTSSGSAIILKPSNDRNEPMIFKVSKGKLPMNGLSCEASSLLQPTSLQTPRI